MVAISKAQLTDGAKKWLAEKGFDRLYGARPMARLIERELKRPLADEILFGKLMAGGRARAEIRKGSLSLTVHPSE